jgi:hypothetical protein
MYRAESSTSSAAFTHSRLKIVAAAIAATRATAMAIG